MIIRTAEGIICRLCRHEHVYIGYCKSLSKGCNCYETQGPNAFMFTNLEYLEYMATLKSNA